MEIIVTGGRHYHDRAFLFNTLDTLYAECRGISFIIHGGAIGADTLAGEWARARGVLELVYPADWARYGVASGPIRNREMLYEHSEALVVAFPGGRGTKNCVETARKLKMKVRDLRC